MPQYRLGFFVNREHKRLIEYLEDAFNCFLDSNVELVAQLYASLCHELEEDLAKAFLATDSDSTVPREWLRLKRSKDQSDPTLDTLALILKSPWLKILRRANAIFFRALDQKKTH